MIHAKKVKPEYFEELRKGTKTFELRREDPGEPTFSVGDYLALNECEVGQHSESTHYSGECLLYRITYVLRGSDLLPEGVVALGLKLMPLSFEDIKSSHLLPSWQ